MKHHIIQICYETLSITRLDFFYFGTIMTLKIKIFQLFINTGKASPQNSLYPMQLLPLFYFFIRHSRVRTRIRQKTLGKKKKRWFALLLLVLMIVGATMGELPITKEMFPGIKLDMFFFVSITTIIMAWTNLFPARKYTKYISWDILITIACAFAISKAMVNSGVADSVAKFIIGLSDDYGPHVLLAMVFIITNLFTELITKMQQRLWLFLWHCQSLRN